MMNLSTKQDIETGILIVLALLVAAWLQHHWLSVLIAGGTLAVALVMPIVFRPAAFLWFGLARVLGYVVPYILLTIVFFLLVIPMGMIRRWMGKDSLQLNDFKKATGSILKERNHTYQPEDLKNPF